MKTAIQKADEALDKGEELYCLGDIVHNDGELKRLKERGMVFIDHAQLRQMKDKTVMFRAHGEPPASYLLIAENHHRLIDASCPVVLKLQQRIGKARQSGEQILIYGKKGHPEVDGLLGHAGESAVVANEPAEIDMRSLSPAVTLFCQTTQPVGGMDRMAAFLEKAGVQVRVHDTICRCVAGRYPGLKAFAEGHDAVVFVGGGNSSNARALFAHCREINPRSWFVTAGDSIDPAWFSPGQRVGVTGSASTPLWQLKQVAGALENLLATEKK